MAAAGWLADSPAAAEVRAAVLIGMPRDVGYLLDSFTITMDLNEATTRRLRALFLRRYGRTPEQYSSLDVAPRIRAPVLLVHGSADELVPLEQARQITQALPQVELYVVAGQNHSGPLRDAAAIERMTRFVADRMGAARA
jgi:dipeptidyl aminopeptidase/acylaminoacyl peptidase